MEQIVKKILTDSLSVAQTFIETHGARLVTFSRENRIGLFKGSEAADLRQWGEVPRMLSTWPRSL